MTDRTVLVPNANHPISIEKCASTVLVHHGALQIAKTTDALTLSEAHYPPVQYIPRRDADMSRLTRSTRTSYCPYKGEATYYSIAALGASGTDAVWSYEAPYPAVNDIAGHLAFYPDRVSIEFLSGQ